MEKSWRDRINECLNGAGPHIVFQPIFQLEPYELMGYEALSRFPYHGPAEWFEEAINLGLNFELELASVRKALISLPKLPPRVYMAINVAPTTVIHPSFSETVSRFDMSNVVLELTEHKAVEDYGYLRSKLDSLRHLGAVVCTPVGPSSIASSSAPKASDQHLRLAVDDLGAGFASMRHVLALKPDFMKLDVALVHGIDKSHAQRSMVASMVTFGARMGIRVVAEGVETDPEFVTVRALDVHSAQGFLLGRPGPLPEEEK